MSLAREFDVGSNCLTTGRILGALHNHDVEKIAQYIRSTENFERVNINCPPANEHLLLRRLSTPVRRPTTGVPQELGRHLSDAIVQNAHIKTLHFNNEYFAIRDMAAWIGSRNTLVNMTSLEFVKVVAYDDMSALDCSALFSLLLTSTSLRKFDIYFGHDNGRSNDVMSALLTYVSAASLREFELSTNRLSKAAFTALCNGVALSTVRHFTLRTGRFPEVNLETAAESLAQMIVESSLEEVTIDGGLSTWRESLISALKLTAPVRNVDFAFTQIEGYSTRLMINREWKPLIFSANTPLALWPHVLEKSHVFPETSHASVDIVFYVLKEKPDLVPAP